MKRKNIRDNSFTTEDLICPFCTKKVQLEDTRLLQLNAWLNHHVCTVDIIQAVRKKEFQDWCCRACEKAGYAQYPDHSRQNFGIGGPILLYVSKELECTTCTQVYTFSASEQQFWYEELRFNYSSFPRNCPECRKKLRRPKVLQKKLMVLLEGDLTDATVLEQISAIYKELGIGDKADLFYRRARNLKK